MTASAAFNPDHLATRTDLGNMSVTLIGPLQKDSDTNGFIEFTIKPKTEPDCFHLVGSLVAELNNAIRYELQIVAYWFLPQDALPTEEQLRDFALHRGLFDLIAVVNHEIRGLGIRYRYPYPSFGGPEIEQLRKEIMNESHDVFTIPSE